MLANEGGEQKSKNVYKVIFIDPGWAGVYVGHYGCVRPTGVSFKNFLNGRGGGQASHTRTFSDLASLLWVTDAL